MTERAVPRSISPSPRMRTRSNHHSSSGLDVDDFRSLCIGSPIPTVAHGSNNADGFTYDDTKTLNYSDYKQDRLLEKASSGSPPICPAITVDKSKMSSGDSLSSHLGQNSPCEYNAESGAGAPVSPVICPASPTPLNGLTPRSPLQRRSANNSKYVTYHRADLPPPAGKGHHRASSVSETTETIHLSTIGNSRGHTRADTYLPVQDDKIKRSLDDVTVLSTVPPVSPRSTSTTDVTSASACHSSMGSGGDKTGTNQYPDYHRKRALPARLAPLKVKATPNVQ